MAETTQINKIRQKRFKSLAKKNNNNNREQSASSYFYPKNNLYTRQEFELLDTIYSEDPPILTDTELKPEVIEEDFWPQDKEKYLNASNLQNNLLTKVTWFISGVMLTSVIWLVYFQLKVYEIKTKSDTQIVFQKSAALMTDKTVDKEVASKLQNQNSKVDKNSIKFNFPNLFSSRPTKVKQKVEQKGVSSVVPQTALLATQHVVRSGDSLWIIANKYYSNPSPQNIDKIMKANNMKRIGVLSLGQKLVIPQ